MLYLIATPIGNLDDISKRALQVLSSCDAILCEDTRRSQILLSRYGIQKPLISYHKFKEQKTLKKILADLQAGINLALISDAGTPCINDPGQTLVNTCLEHQIAVQSIPGPCSVIQALILSGFETTPFQFVGFLPKKENALNKMLHEIAAYKGTTVAFESPDRLIDTLGAVDTIDASWTIAVVREMTKTFEETVRGMAKELLAYFQKGVKGEVALIFSPNEKIADTLSIEETIALLQKYHGVSLKEAIKLAAKIKNRPKREIYQSCITRD